MSDLDALIESQHRQAEAAEHQALEVIERLSRIPGIQPWLNASLRKRAYGTCPNPFADNNLSAQSAVSRADRPFAQFLAGKAGRPLPGPDYLQQQQRQRQQQAAERLMAETEAMRARNLATRQRHQHAATHGRWCTTTGRVV